MALFRCSRYRLVCGSILCLISMISLPMVLSSAAFATADSGYIYELTTGPYGSTYVDNCVNAEIADVANNNAYVESDTNPNQCNTAYAYTMPAGYLGANADGYINGTYCGSTGFYYNSSPTYLFGVGAQLCSNPSGSQTFYTVATAEIWDYYSGAWQYAMTNSVTSPSQNY